MPLSSILLLLALLVMVALFVARPLFAPGPADESAQDGLSPWLVERERVLDALAELDADWQLGKVAEELYSTQRQQLIAKGATALKELERLDEGRKKVATDLDDAQLEKLIAAQRAKRKK